MNFSDLLLCFTGKKETLSTHNEISLSQNSCVFCKKSQSSFDRKKICLSRCAHLYHEECLTKCFESGGRCSSCKGFISDSFDDENLAFIKRISCKDFAGIEDKEIMLILKYGTIESPDFPQEIFIEFLADRQWDFNQIIKKDHDIKFVLISLLCGIGNENIVKILVEKYKVDLNVNGLVECPPSGDYPSFSSFSLLNCAVNKGNLLSVKYFIESCGLEVDHQSCLIAAGRNLTDILKYLLDIKPEFLNFPDCFKLTCLIEAVRYECLNTVNQLLELGADTECKVYCIYDTTDECFQGRTPLLISIDFGFYDIAELLLTNGADPYNTCKDGYNALHYACSGGPIKLIEMILEKKVPINSLAKNLKTPLHKSCGIYDIASFLIEKGADVMAQDDEGNTPLHCVSFRNVDVLELFFKAGADFNKPNGKGYTPLHYASISKYNTNDSILALIKLGANVNAETNDGETPLRLARREFYKFSRDLYEEKAKILLENGAI